MANKDKIITQMRCDKILYEKVKIIADSELRSVNAQIEYFIRQSIETYEKEHGVISLPEDS